MGVLRIYVVGHRRKGPVRKYIVYYKYARKFEDNLHNPFCQKRPGLTKPVRYNNKASSPGASYVLG